MTDAHTVPANPAEDSRNPKLPWILLAIVMAGMVGVLWWGYNEREAVTQFAVSSLLNKEIAELLPEGTDPTYLAVRMTALMRALNQGQVDPERLRGLGNEFRTFYSDRKLDKDELEALLQYAEAAVDR